MTVTTPRSARGHYLDGGTRLNSPIKPALHFGADKVIVVGLEPFAPAVGRASTTKGPGIADVAANILDGLLVDQVAYDLRRLAAIKSFFVEDMSTGTLNSPGRTGWPGAMRPTVRSPTRSSRLAAGELSDTWRKPSSSAATAASAVCASSTSS